eukprot:152724-Prorocentrum_minimum.AAC.1
MGYTPVPPPYSAPPAQYSQYNVPPANQYGAPPASQQNVTKSEKRGAKQLVEPTHELRTCLALPAKGTRSYTAERTVLSFIRSFVRLSAGCLFRWGCPLTRRGCLLRCWCSESSQGRRMAQDGVESTVDGAAVVGLPLQAATSGRRPHVHSTDTT